MTGGAETDLAVMFEQVWSLFVASVQGLERWSVFDEFHVRGVCAGIGAAEANLSSDYDERTIPFVCASR